MSHKVFRYIDYPAKIACTTFLPDTNQQKYGPTSCFNYTLNNGIRIAVL